MCDHCAPIRSAFRRLLRRYGGRGAIPSHAITGLTDSLDGITIDGGTS